MPPVILRQLRRYRIARSLTITIRSLLWSTTVVFAVLPASLYLDHWLKFPANARFWISAITILLSGCVFVDVLRPLFHHETPTDLAMEIERFHPRFDQKLITLLSLPTAEVTVSLPGSMIGQLRFDVMNLSQISFARPLKMLRSLCWPVLVLLLEITITLLASRLCHLDGRLMLHQFLRQAN